MKLYGSVRKEVDAINCKRCGAVLPPNARACPRCGTALTRPSGQEVRQRIRTVRAATPVPPPRKAAARSAARRQTGASQALPAETTFFISLIGVGLWALQLLFLFVKSVFLGAGSHGMRFSLFALTKENGTAFLGILLLFFCLLGLVGMIVPLFLGGERFYFRLAVVPAGFSLLLTAAALLGIRRAGVYPSARIGLIAWLFLLNCILLTALALRVSGPAFARRTESKPRAAQKPPESDPAPRQPASVPDAETIASLRRIAQMHKQGLISDEEFARVKAECVARGWIRE